MERVPSVVAQTCSLPYRRFAIGKTSARSNAFDFADTLQDAILRYGRLQICATFGSSIVLSQREGCTPMPDVEQSVST
jgi:hypothetical protein